MYVCAHTMISYFLSIGVCLALLYLVIDTIVIIWLLKPRAGSHLAANYYLVLTLNSCVIVFGLLLRLWHAVLTGLPGDDPEYAWFSLVWRFILASIIFTFAAALIRSLRRRGASAGKPRATRLE
jgi:hypothetical protein